MDFPPIKRLLSVQSHVVHGYVGNRAATFPLQCNGWDVDVLNTVNFSNHTGYGSVSGSKTTASELREVYEGLKAIEVEYDAFLTGYVPSAEALEEVCLIGHELKARNPNLLWLLDPVMGDEGQLYVSDTVIPIYRKTLLQGGVDVITPNQFEAELLVEFKIECKHTLLRALETLHTKYKVPNVVISSLQFGECDKIYAAASHWGEGTMHSSLFEIPLIESYFTGVGDLFSALLLDRIQRLKTDNVADAIDTAVGQVLTVMAVVLQTTSAAAEREMGHKIMSKMGSAETMKACELRLIECRSEYEKTDVKFKATKLT
ncbi:CYFA0S01e20164g1_1 [Cyberlindnera fabianii]|uniref:pyridoxal kinase n=1 Tax=Cyberlindnera fabianii TaxID=36022 RepID=A0A061AKF8_CYBFA|nr:CYFA0S01e20164g1_1 [Cyberlindnera fabianii]